LFSINKLEQLIYELDMYAPYIKDEKVMQILQTSVLYLESAVQVAETEYLLQQSLATMGDKRK
jgi:hypothetical protein